MQPLRVVCDSNALISYLWGSTAMESVIDAIENNIITPLLSEAMISEFRRVARKPKLRRFIDPASADMLIEDLLAISPPVYPRRIIRCSEDPDDDKFLECACEGNADYIISGDRHLLVLNPFEGIPILTPGEFVRTVLNRLKR